MATDSPNHTLTMPMALDHLPASVQLLIENIGLAHAMAVVKAFGGRPLYIPRSPTEALITALGEAGAVALCERYANEYWNQVPKCHKALLAIRDAQWLEAYLSNKKSQVELAAESGLTWLAVHRALKRASQQTGFQDINVTPDEDRQMGLEW